MLQTITTRTLRALTVSAVVAVCLVLGVVAGRLVLGPVVGPVLGPFAGLGVAVALLAVVAPRWGATTGGGAAPHAVLAASAARVREGAADDALPGLARVLGEGTAAARAAVWLVVPEGLVARAVHVGGSGRRDVPDAAAAPDPGTTDPTVRDAAVGSAADELVPSLAALLARPDVDHAVPVLDGPVLRAVLTLGKPGRAVTPADRRLVQDVAGAAGLLLRGVARGGELRARVARVDELAREMQASRERLHRAREVERRRLVAELGGATTERLAAFRSGLDDLDEVLEEAAEAPEGPDGADEREELAGLAEHHLAESGRRLEELLDRFRVIARGVHPAVLRDQGPRAALEEVVADLPRPVRVTGRLTGRLPWEVESGLYHAVAAALQLIAGHPAEDPVELVLDQVDGRVQARLEAGPDEGTTVAAGPAGIRDALADDAERLTALGGALETTVDGAGHVALRVWLPAELSPSVEAGPVGAGPVGAAGVVR